MKLMQMCHSFVMGWDRQNSRYGCTVELSWDRQIVQKIPDKDVQGCHGTGKQRIKSQIQMYGVVMGQANSVDNPRYRFIVELSWDRQIVQKMSDIDVPQSCHGAGKQYRNPYVCKEDGRFVMESHVQLNLLRVAESRSYFCRQDPDPAHPLIWTKKS